MAPDKFTAMENYLLSISKTEAAKDGTIHDPQSKLKIKVFDLLKSRFTPSSGEKRFFVTAGDETLAFETKGYKKHRELLILQMIAWYCLYLGLIEVQIHSSWPLSM
ncbi:hypothetical protein MuYL_3359 [Mucilaginibacter xinganensis]|uniref:Uncharacterized protein n=2 Tax=Mucilaginibacter xinganensis TaxID=1234841 RepID=A0A223NZW3_9SPHI|nr:hypothetical protein MuYL_3359 [Mucilaginibacter xinganensis]